MASCTASKFARMASADSARSADLAWVAGCVDPAPALREGDELRLATGELRGLGCRSICLGLSEKSEGFQLTRSAPHESMAATHLDV